MTAKNIRRTRKARKKKKMVRQPHHTTPQLGQAVATQATQPKQTLMPYDENLLERSRTQWQFGDWESLVELGRDTLQHHPDRAKLALLAAAGRLQTGNDNDIEARQFIRLAQDWGIDKKLVSRVLIAGIHNNLGRAAAIVGQKSRALSHFEKAISIGAPSSATRLLTQARINEQFAQLNLTLPESRSLELNFQDTHTIFIAGPALKKPPISVELFFSKHEGDRTEALEEVRKSVNNLLPIDLSAEIDWVSTKHQDKEFFFAHFSGDYIPEKMAEKKQFYEWPFLNLLARLHQSGKIIVDGGANIGNHTIFFAGVIGAQVIAFEPQPFNYEFLITNTYLNRLESKVDIRKTALGDKSGYISLVQAISNNHGSYTASTKLAGCENGETQSPAAFDVEVSTLDEELDNYSSSISIIKLDLEGMELDALQGARNVIAKSLPVIAVECFTRATYQKIKEFLSDFDYFVIDSTNATPTFIFLTRKNSYHIDTLSRYLEMSSLGKFSAKSSFIEISSEKK